MAWDTIAAPGGAADRREHRERTRSRWSLLLAETFDTQEKGPSGPAGGWGKADAGQNAKDVPDKPGTATWISVFPLSSQHGRPSQITSGGYAGHILNRVNPTEYNSRHPTEPPINPEAQRKT